VISQQYVSRPIQEQIKRAAGPYADAHWYLRSLIASQMLCTNAASLITPFLTQIHHKVPHTLLTLHLALYHPSWKVLFFLENSGTRKVLENHFGFGTS